MNRITKFLTRTLSFRLSLMVLVALAALLMVSLLIMFRYSRKAVKDEALQKAGQTLEATVQNIDNVLLSVEQSSGNIYWRMVSHISKPEMMDVFCRRLVEGNPYITGCVIAFEPNFYKERGEHFMVSYDVTGKTYENYPYYQRDWYIRALETGRPFWTEPWSDASSGDRLITFVLPVYGPEGKNVGVLAADVSLKLFSKIILETKPSPNSFCTLLGKNGSFIVHPDTTKLMHLNVLTASDQDIHASVKQAAQAMVSGKSGYRFVELNDKNCYIFYKPFKRANVPGRSMVELGWSAGIIFPENDVFGDYVHLHYLVLIIAVIGLLLLLILGQLFIHRRLLPLRLLANTAQQIAQGHYDEPIPDAKQQDEVGRLQNHFQQMQQSLSAHVGEMNRLTIALQERGKELQQTYEQAQEADLMKTNFLYNMSNQMTSPVNNISHSVMIIRHHLNDLEEEETNSLVEDILQQGEKITNLLNQLISDSEQNKSKQ